jgi:malonyl CoA-acyl carrier protein transacylase
MNKKELKNKYEHQQQEEFENSLPTDSEIFEKLFDYLDEELENGCNHTLHLTETFLTSEKVNNVDEIKGWLRDNGGFCDCEVLANIEELFEKE